VVWWADAETAQTLDSALAALTYRLQPAATAEAWTTTGVADWAVNWLQAHTGWLLILDNVEDPALISSLLGRLPTGDILITTRRDISWHVHGVTPLTLDLLPRPAAITLLQDITPRTSGGAAAPAPDGFDSDVADALAAELGDLPLALHQAGAYITANRLPLVTYLQRLRAQTNAMLRKTAHGADANRAVAKVFDLTVETLLQAEPAAVDILRGLSWLAPSNLSRGVITYRATREADQARKPDTAKAENELVDVDDLLGLLASYSLITLTPATVGMHRLLQAAVREHDRTAPSTGQDPGPGLTGGQATALAWLSEAIPTDPGRNVAGWGLWHDLLPHLDALFGHLPAHLPNLDFAALLTQTAHHLWAQGRHHRHAFRLDEQAVTITGAALGPDHPDTGFRLAGLAGTLDALGRPADALPLRERAVAITRGRARPRPSRHGHHAGQPRVRLLAARPEGRGCCRTTGASPARALTSQRQARSCPLDSATPAR
jgi:hypothetical protein